MGDITLLQSSAITHIKEAMQVIPVRLKHPYPVRPGRMLGLIRLDGQVFTAERLTRAVFLRIEFPVLIRVFSTFIFPKIEYDLPVFSCETIVIGKKRIFVMDSHPGGAGGVTNRELFYHRLAGIMTRYPELMRCRKTSSSGIAALQSKAAVRVAIPEKMDTMAVNIFSEYFSAYLDLVTSAEPLTGIVRAKLQASFDSYLKTVVEHDPGVKGNIMFFGKKQGLERALDMFYGV